MMRARMATFTVDDPAKIDDEIATTRRYLADGRMPEGIPATGFLMLVDREGGRLLAEPGHRLHVAAERDDPARAGVRP